MSKSLDAAYDLLKRLPPRDLQTNVHFVSELLDDEEADEILQEVDTPLKVMKGKTGDFLSCDYNRDGDNYRSPHDNKYYPEDDGEALRPNKYLRDLEVKANHIFAIYTEQYYGEGGICSVYFWEVEENNFAACVLIHKDGVSRQVEEGSWDSIHIVDVLVDGKHANYSLSTTVILTMITKDKSLDLSGSIQRKDELKKVKFNKKDKSHIVHIGDLIQKMENMLRDSLQHIYFDKSREISRTLRCMESASVRAAKEKLAEELEDVVSNKKR